MFSALFALFKYKYGASKRRLHKKGVFFWFSKGVQKAQAGPGAAVLIVQGSFTLLAKT